MTGAEVLGKHVEDEVTEVTLCVYAGDEAAWCRGGKLCVASCSSLAFTLKEMGAKGATYSHRTKPNKIAFCYGLTVELCDSVLNFSSQSCAC